MTPQSMPTQQPNQRRTFRVQINRINNTLEPSKGVFIPLLTADRIIVEFQCDAKTKPSISNIMEMQI